MGKIEAKNIVKYFQHDGKPLKAIGGVNLTVNDGEFVCIVGPKANACILFRICLEDWEKRIYTIVRKQMRGGGVRSI